MDGASINSRAHGNAGIKRASYAIIEDILVLSFLDIPSDCVCTRTCCLSTVIFEEGVRVSNLLIM